LERGNGLLKLNQLVLKRIDGFRRRAGGCLYDLLAPHLRQLLFERLHFVFPLPAFGRPFGLSRRAPFQLVPLPGIIQLRECARGVLFRLLQTRFKFGFDFSQPFLKGGLQA